MARFVLTWELGGGLGHAGRLVPLGRELARRGHAVAFVLRDLVQTAPLLAGAPGPCVQAPVWLHQTVGVPSAQASMAEILLVNGYLDGRHLRGLARGWADLFGVLRPDAVVADSSPTAVLAARALGVPSATVGSGFFLPPDRSPMPAFRDWEPVPPARVAHAEQRALASANAVLAEHGRPPLDRLAPVLLGDLPGLCTWAELDHYARTLAPGQQYHGPSLSEPGGMAPAWPAGLGAGPRVFAYVKDGHPGTPALLRALDAVGAHTLCYLPEVAAGKAPPVPSRRIAYARGPVNLDAALTECDLVVCHGGEGTVAQALLAGVPVLLLPMQAEQFLTGRRLEQQALGLNAGARPQPVDYAALVRQLLGDGRVRDAVAAFQARYAGFTRAGQARALVDGFEGLVAGAAGPAAGAAGHPGPAGHGL